MDVYGQSPDMRTQHPPCQDGYKAAQLVPLPDLSFVCGSTGAAVVTSLAGGTGCPNEYVLVPLLSCCASLMGNKTFISVHPSWQEPPVLWTIVGARSGSRKTSILRKLMTPLLELQHEQDRHWQLSRPSVESSTVGSRKLFAGYLNFSQLTDVLEKNDGQILSITEDLELFQNKVGIMPQADSEHRHDFETLYDGLPLVKVEDGNITYSGATCFNHSGFSDPQHIIDMMLKQPTWLCSRYLIACPPNVRKSAFGESFDSSSNQNSPSLKSIFQCLLTYHQQQREYIFSEDAVRELKRFHDEEWSTILAQLDLEDQNGGVVGKSMGHIVRLAGILKAFSNACDFTYHSSIRGVSGDFRWDLTINKDIMQRTIELSKYFLEQKLAMTFMLGTGFFSIRPSYVVAPSHSQISVVQQPTSSNIAVPVLTFQEDLDMNALPSSVTDDDSNQGTPHTAEFVHLDKTQFVVNHGRRIKRLLECYDDGGGVSATTAAQRSIAPAVRVHGTNNRHPAWASALFFQKVAELGIGCAEQVKHPSNRKIYWRFKRKPWSELTDKNRQLLQYLKVDISLYSKIGHSAFVNQSKPPVSPGTSNIGLPPGGMPSPVIIDDPESPSQKSGPVPGLDMEVSEIKHEDIL